MNDKHKTKFKKKLKTEKKKKEERERYVLPNNQDVYILSTRSFDKEIVYKDQD